MNCTNCQKPSAGDYCGDCSQFRERLEKLRQAQKQFWRRVRAGEIKLERPGKKREGAYFMQQCRLAAEQKATRGRSLPISGQDAALPPGDRG